jgi:hypothetical protein
MNSGGKPLDVAIAEDISTGYRVAGISSKDGEYKICPTPVSHSLAIAYVFLFGHLYPESLFEVVSPQEDQEAR